MLPVVILCGGKGTRMREGEPTVPKPLVHVGDPDLGVLVEA